MKGLSSLATEKTTAVPLPETAARLLSLDAFRGFTMLLMASEIMRIPEIARGFTDSSFARFIASSLSHREWVGCSPWDLIQPSFMLMVGVALPYSLASRKAKGESFAQTLAHTLWRSFVLIALGIFLRSQSRSQTNFTFEDVLTQIGLGYTFLFLLGRTTPKVQLIAAVVILIGYWAAFALYPLPAPDFDRTTVGVPRDWPHHLNGFAAHWDKHTNFAARMDQWFLNLFPREKIFVSNGGGYLTLSFIPSLVTMIFGLLAGGLLRSERSGSVKFRLLTISGVIGVILGAALHLLGVCPLVKRIWTPTWTIYSAGWVLLFLAAWYYVIDLKGWRRGTFPLLVVGMNSIAMYFLVHVIVDDVGHALKIHLGQHVFELFGMLYAPVIEGAAVLLILWLMLWWMYQRRIFLRV